MSELRYIALKELPVGVKGKIVTLKPGDEIPNPEEWGRAIDSNLAAGRIAAVPVESLGKSLGDYSKRELEAELKRREAKAAKAKAAKAKAAKAKGAA